MAPKTGVSNSRPPTAAFRIKMTFSLQFEVENGLGEGGIVENKVERFCYTTLIDS